MKITRRQLRQIIKESMILQESDADGDGIPDSDEIRTAWTFADTAELEAKKLNDQTGLRLVTDQAYWERLGIITGEDLARSVLAQTYSDLYKEINGIRPRWVKFSEMTPKEIQVMLDELDQELPYEETEIIKEALPHVVFDDIHEVPDDLEFFDPHEAYGIGHDAGMEHAEEEESGDQCPGSSRLSGKFADESQAKSAALAASSHFSDELRQDNIQLDDSILSDIYASLLGLARDAQKGT